MAKGRRPLTRDHPMKWIERYLNRKKERKQATRKQPLDEVFAFPSTTESSNPTDDFVPTPQISVIAIPLNAHNDIYQAGLFHQGGDAANIAPILAGVGVDGSNCFNITADNEGLHKWGLPTLMMNDNGQFSVWVYGNTTKSGEDYEYVLSVHQDSEDATPVDEESLIIRWEASEEILRLYPDITNSPNTHVTIALPEATWQDPAWHKITATWSYQDQFWTMKWDDTEGTLAVAIVTTWPTWDELTQVDIFTDLNFENVIYHRANHIVFGPITDPTALGILDLIAPLSLFFDDEADPIIGGYKRLRRAIPVGAQATVTQTGKNTDGEMLLGSWVTTMGIPGSELIPEGHWDFFLYTHVDNASSQSFIKVYVYKRNLAGAETELFNVTSNDINNLAVAQHLVIYHQVADIPILATDRFVLKLFFYTTRPADVQMTFTYDGTVNVSHIHTPFGAAIAPLTSLDNAYNNSPSGNKLIEMDDGPVVLEQIVVEDPFLKLIGTAAPADLNRSIVDDSDVTSSTREGWVKIEVQDDGNQIMDQDYFLPIYTITTDIDFLLLENGDFVLLENGDKIILE